MKPASVDRTDTEPILSKARRRELDQAVIDCIIDDSLPFTSFSKPGMVNLIRTLDSRYRPPSRFTIASRVGDEYYKYVGQVKVSQSQARHGNANPLADVCEVSFRPRSKRMR